jgi:Tn3 transposase DDE domain
LNRGEGRHAVSRDVFHGHKGELRQRYREGQEDQLGALGLVVNILLLWNTLYMQDALEELRTGKQKVRQVTLQHMNLQGTYHLTLPESVAQGNHRPLRRPPPMKSHVKTPTNEMAIIRKLVKEVEDKRTGKKLSVRFGSVTTLPPIIVIGRKRHMFVS